MKWLRQSWGSDAGMAKPWLIASKISIVQETKQVFIILRFLLLFRRNRVSTFSSSEIKTHLQMTQGDCSK